MLLLLLACLCAADKPPAKVPQPAAAKASDPVVSKGDAKPASRPALKRQNALASMLDGDDDSEQLAEVADGEETAAAAPESGAGGGILSQLFTVALVLILRLGLAFWKTMRQKSGTEGTPLPGASAVAAISTMLHKSPLGPVLVALGNAQKSFAEFARSPNAAPVMMGLLIVAMKLVARMDSKASEEAVLQAEEEEEEPVEAAGAAERVEAAVEEGDDDADDDADDGEVEVEEPDEE